MSPYKGSKFSEEEELDLIYSEIEERILLLISEEEEEEEEEEEDRVKKTQRAAPPISDSSWYINSIITQLQPTTQLRGSYYGSENIGKTKNKPWINEYGARNIGGKRISEISSGRRGTGVFIPKSLVHSC